MSFESGLLLDKLKIYFYSRSCGLNDEVDTVKRYLMIYSPTLNNSVPDAITTLPSLGLISYAQKCSYSHKISLSIV